MQNKQLNIGFFGHSHCAGSGYGSFQDQVAKHFDANIVNNGVGQSSEERILFEVKKSKLLDVAVIFHSRPVSLFLPKCTRDIDIRSDEVKAYRGIYGNISSIFKTEEEFIACINYYRSYLYDHNLHINRFQGALLLIDSYCLNKVPAVVHILDNSHVMPWFTEFTSGIRSGEIEGLVRAHKGIDSNGLTFEGNKKIAEVLIYLISQQLADRGRVDHTPK